MSLGLLRSDLMLESVCKPNCFGKVACCCWKQVEINTIASGFGHLGPASGDLQRYIYNSIRHYEDYILSQPIINEFQIHFMGIGGSS